LHTRYRRRRDLIEHAHRTQQFRLGRQKPMAQHQQSPIAYLQHRRQTPVYLLAFTETIEKARGQTAEEKMLPMQPGDVEATYADVESLAKDIGYRPV